MKEDSGLHRSLSERQITMIGVGSAVGVGLFLGSASTIKAAGPSILVAYGVFGMALLFIMRALGEMAAHIPVAGSFSRYAHEYIGPLAGFITGWTYWFVWATDGMAEISAVALYMKVWYPDVPSWIWALSAMIIMPPINLIAVKAFGEFEFWVALLKVIVVLFMMVCGLSIIVFGFGNGGVPTGIHNLWTNGGFMPNGVSGLLMALPMVGFAYLGIEILGLTAGEAKNPEKTLGRASNTIFWRVLVFYVGALAVVLSVVPWTSVPQDVSPFLLIFQKLGIPKMAGIINFVLLATALSLINTGLFSNGRMLFSLSQQGQAPKFLKRVSKNGIPVNGVLVSVFMLLVGVLLNYFAPADVFVWLTAIATFGAVWSWGIILIAHYKYRKSVAPEVISARRFKSPLFPYGTYFAGFILLIVVVVMAFSPDTRVALYVGPIWLVFLAAGYYLFGHGKARTVSEVIEDGQAS